MGRRCVVSGCRNDTRSGLSVHGWPKEKELGRKWDQFIQERRKDWVGGHHRNAHICAAHFLPDDFCGYRQWELGFKSTMKLKRGAVPTVNVTKWSVVQPTEPMWSKPEAKHLSRWSTRAESSTKSSGRSATGEQSGNSEKTTLQRSSSMDEESVWSGLSSPENHDHESESLRGFKPHDKDHLIQRDRPVEGEQPSDSKNALEEEKSQREEGEKDDGFVENSPHISVNIPKLSQEVHCKDTGGESNLQHTGAGLNLQYQRCPAEVLGGNRDSGCAMEVLEDGDSVKLPSERSTDQVLKRADSSESRKKVRKRANSRSQSKRLDLPVVSLEKLQKLKTGKKPYCCTWCGKRFLTRGVLLQHEVSHSKDKFYYFYVSGERPCGDVSVKPHRRVHTKKKTCSCSQCGKKFISQSALSSHLCSHTGEKLYPCHNCGKSFRYSLELSCHVKAVHPKEKPYHCTLCNERFLIVPTVAKDKHQPNGVLPHCSHCRYYFKSKVVLEKRSLNCMKRVNVDLNVKDQSSSGKLLSGDSPLGQHVVQGEQHLMDSVVSPGDPEPMDSTAFCTNPSEMLRKHCIESADGKLSLVELPGIKPHDEDHLIQRDRPVEGEQPSDSKNALEEEKSQREEGEKDDGFVVNSPHISVNIPKLSQEVHCKDTGGESNLQHTGAGLNLQYQRCPAEVLGGNRDSGCAMEVLEDGDSVKLPSERSTDQVLKRADSSESRKKVRKRANSRSQSKRLDLPVSLEKLQQSKTRKKPYQCTQCGKRFLNRGVLLQHEVSHSKDKYYYVYVSGERPCGDVSVKPHQGMHTHKKTYCSQCGKGFCSRKALSVHLRSHTGEKPFHCRSCGKSFSDKKTLSDHIKETHPGKIPYYCTQCKESFLKASTYKKHHKRHTRVTPYLCSHCAIYFKSKGNFEKHNLYHLKKMHIDKNGQDQTSLGNPLWEERQPEQHVVPGDGPLMDSTADPEPPRGTAHHTNTGETVRQESIESEPEVPLGAVNSASIKEEPLEDELKLQMNPQFRQKLNCLDKQTGTEHMILRESPVEKDCQVIIHELEVKTEEESEKGFYFNTAETTPELRINIQRPDLLTSPKSPVESLSVREGVHTMESLKKYLYLYESCRGEILLGDRLLEQHVTAEGPLVAIGSPTGDPPPAFSVANHTSPRSSSSMSINEGAQDDPSVVQMTVTPPTVPMTPPTVSKTPPTTSMTPPTVSMTPSEEKRENAQLEDEGMAITDNDDAPWWSVTSTAAGSPREVASPEWEIVELLPETVDLVESHSSLHGFLAQLEQELQQVNVASVQQQLRQNILSLVYDAQRECEQLNASV